MKRILLTFGIVLMGAQALALDNVAAFLDQAYGARSAALGSSGIALNKNLDTLYQNPASISYLTNPVAFSTMSFQSFETNYLSFQTFTNSLGFPLAISVWNASVGGILETSYNSNAVRYEATGRELGYQGTAIYVTSAIILPEALCVGLSGKYITESLANQSANGIGADLGVWKQFGRDFALGATYYNILTPKLKWTTESQTEESLKPTFGMGFAFKTLARTVLITGDVRIAPGLSETSNYTFSGGLEYKPMPMLALRLGCKSQIYGPGYNTLTFSRQPQWSSGLGLALGGLSLDFAYIMATPELQDTAGSVSRLSLSAGF